MCEARLSQIESQECAGLAAKDDAASVALMSLAEKDPLTKVERVDSVDAGAAKTDSSPSWRVYTKAARVPRWFRMIPDL
jgi:hypothetical protein